MNHMLVELDDGLERCAPCGSRGSPGSEKPMSVDAGERLLLVQDDEPIAVREGQRPEAARR